MFEEIPVGLVYVVAVSAKDYAFTPDTAVVNLTSNETELIFTGIRQ